MRTKYRLRALAYFISAAVCFIRMFITAELVLLDSAQVHGDKNISFCLLFFQFLVIYDTTALKFCFSAFHHAPNNFYGSSCNEYVLVKQSTVAEEQYITPNALIKLKQPFGEMTLKESCNGIGGVISWCG